MVAIRSSGVSAGRPRATIRSRGHGRHRGGGIMRRVMGTGLATLLAAIGLGVATPAGASLDAGAHCDRVASPSGSDAKGTGICLSATSFRGISPDLLAIEGNRIHNCGRLPPKNHDHGIYLTAGLGAVIADNVVYDNADRGIQLYPSVLGARIYANTVDGNG